ncbi:uncharacterized protein LOC142491685 [Ascaphus truei]|uniref:uncharacterized protein LOC142491685 n=1 Tax=Ascaphus truei TaxID=8439 RepID=UPI003F5A4E82
MLQTWSTREKNHYPLGTRGFSNLLLAAESILSVPAEQAAPGQHSPSFTEQEICSTISYLPAPAVQTKQYEKSALCQCAEICLSTKGIPIDSSRDVSKLELEEESEDLMLHGNLPDSLSRVYKQSKIRQRSIRKKQPCPSQEFSQADSLGLIPQGKGVKTNDMDHSSCLKSASRKSNYKRQLSVADIESITSTIEAVVSGEWRAGKSSEGMHKSPHPDVDRTKRIPKKRSSSDLEADCGDDKWVIIQNRSSGKIRLRKTKSEEEFAVDSTKLQGEFEMRSSILPQQCPVTLEHNYALVPRKKKKTSNYN